MTIQNRTTLLETVVQLEQLQFLELGQNELSTLPPEKELIPFMVVFTPVIGILGNFIVFGVNFINLIFFALCPLTDRLNLHWRK